MTVGGSPDSTTLPYVSAGGVDAVSRRLRFRVESRATNDKQILYIKETIIPSSTFTTRVSPILWLRVRMSIVTPQTSFAPRHHCFI